MIEVEWLVENRVILFRPMGDVTIDELKQSIATLQQMLDDGEPPIHTISDSRKIGKYPISVSALKSFMRKHSNSGITVIVGGDGLSKFISNLLAQFSQGLAPEFVTTTKEALALLQLKDDTLPRNIEPHVSLAD